MPTPHQAPPTLEADARLPQPWWTPRRKEVLSRAAAAVLGGYALTAAVTVLLTKLLPGTKAEAVLAATQLGFAVYTAAVIWVFAAADARRAWSGLLVPAVLCVAATALFFPGAGK